ncbi:MAG: phosphoribosyl-AMP cyclohydrolase [Rhizobiaceae bacterium]|jgi:phosphoribosyl-AMP cyclohydrolase|nr:phosphoribosyl-AMP cyclohydrolase [Rhizobiaceae bacterium]
MSDFPTLDDKQTLEHGSVLAPRFNADGLITAIVQDFESQEILMLAHMNAQALKKTLETGQSHFWSRSRQELWHKGATSGHVQQVREILVDCDQDAVILKVSVDGNPACHTGARSCFFRSVKHDDTGHHLVVSEKSHS